MLLPLAEDLNYKHAVLPSKCSEVDDLYSCLMTLDAAEANSLFSTSDYDTNVMAPCSVRGCSAPGNPVLYLGLPIVDGAFLRMSALEAMPQVSPLLGTILIQSLAGEGGWAPDPSIAENWTSAEFMSAIVQRYHTLDYDVDSYASLLRTYLSDPRLTSNQMRYQTQLADSGMSFANYALARAANTSNVLVGYVRCSPARPFPLAHSTAGGNTLIGTMAFHMWDYIAGAGAWGMLVPLPYGAASPYVPTAEDESFGAMLRSHWKAIVWGTGVPWAPFGASSTVGVIDCNKTIAEELFRTAQETSWKALVKGPWEDFWWIN